MKTRIVRIIILFSLILPFHLWGQNSEIIVNQTSNQKKNIIQATNLKINHDYYQSLINKLKSASSRSRFVYLDFEDKLSVTVLKEVSLPPYVLGKIQKTTHYYPIKNPSKLKLKSYWLLLENIKTGGGTNIIPGINPVRIPKNKKLKLTIIFKSGDGIKPNQDVESYAVVYLDKKRIGVTEQKLLSQPKVFKTNTTYEKHLLKLQIYIQDPHRRRWRRLRNIEQPGVRYFNPSHNEDEFFIEITYFPWKKIGRYEFKSSYQSQ